MGFIMLNGRTPCRHSACARCSKPIGTRYLREISTRLPYCNLDCYADHCAGAIRAIESQATTTYAAQPHRETKQPARLARRVEAKADTPHSAAPQYARRNQIDNRSIG